MSACEYTITQVLSRNYIILKQRNRTLEAYVESMVDVVQTFHDGSEAAAAGGDVSDEEIFRDVIEHWPPDAIHEAAVPAAHPSRPAPRMPTKETQAIQDYNVENVAAALTTHIDDDHIRAQLVVAQLERI